MNALHAEALEMNIKFDQELAASSKQTTKWLC
jgi:hypothetical protein